MKEIEPFLNKIIQGDMLEVLRKMPNESVDCVITSPPYYGLRDYGVEGQLGLEKTLDEYLEKMLQVTAEIKRVMKPTATLWWNHGDSYGNLGGKGHGRKNRPNQNDRYEIEKPKVGYEKSLLLQNFRLVQRMIDEQQFILRNLLIWHKPNVMPSSVKDRFTVDFEPVFFLTKSKKYWYEPQYEPQSELTLEVASHYKNPIRSQGKKADKMGGMYSIKRNFILPLGRNKRCVWKIPTHPFSEAHFATFPPKLVEPMIRAGCPEMICRKCGEARERIFEREYLETTKTTPPNKGNIGSERLEGQAAHMTRDGFIPNRENWIKDLGHTDCGCNAGWDSGIVLDPFMGSGTVAVVARQLKRNYIGIDISKDYCAMAEQRIKVEAPQSLAI